jgi:hypothetical protein
LHRRGKFNLEERFPRFKENISLYSGEINKVGVEKAIKQMKYNFGKFLYREKVFMIGKTNPNLSVIICF